MKRKEEETLEYVKHYHGELSGRETLIALTAVEWVEKALTDKAVEWVRNNWREYVYQDGDGVVHFRHWEADFRKAMEE